MIDQQTRLYGLLGHPVAHSLSPAMHNAAFRAAGLNAVFLAFDTQDVEGFVRAMRALPMGGASVTMPHKSAVMPWLDGVDPAAQRIGAVNTLVYRDGRLTGYNTDGIGALRALQAVTQLPGKRCLMIGAGGAARAIGHVLVHQGVELSVTNRTDERGMRLASSLGCRFVPLQAARLGEADIVIQATPVGMGPGDPPALLPLEGLRQGMVVMDAVYNPLQTRFLKAAAEQGCLVVDGLGMFVQQGVEQFRLWTSMEPPVDVMRRALLQSLTGNR